jgi:hypothetical protein
VGELRTAAGLVGIWQVWSGNLFLISDADLTKASNTTGLPLTALGSLGLTWLTPGANGGLQLDTDGVVEFPAFGSWKGDAHLSCRAECRYTPGTLIDFQRAGAGFSSVAGNGYATGGAFYQLSVNSWRQTICYGARSALTQLTFTTGGTLANATYPIPANFGLGALIAPRNTGQTSYSIVGSLKRRDASALSGVPYHTSLFGTGQLTSQTDLQACVAFNDAASGDALLVIERISLNARLP